MNVQSALNAYKETDLSEIDSASPHRLIEMTFQDLKKNLLIIRRTLNNGKRIGGDEASRSIAALEILRSSLNFKDGGDIAKNLDQIYVYSLDQLAKIIKDDSEHELDSVIAIVTSLVDAWSTIPG
jgi:flagellar protein FliS